MTNGADRKRKTRTIVAMGGGGFSMEPENPLLDDFVLSLIPAERLTAGELPKVCFVPTASGDSAGYVERFQEAFEGRADTSVLSLFAREQYDLREFVLSQDVIYVGGGSTANLLVVWRLHGLDLILAEAAEDGVVLAGVSAGMNCWFDASVTDSFGPGLKPLNDGLGMLTGSVCPHYDGEVERQPTYRGLVSTGAIAEGYAADDGCALVFRDGHLDEAVSSRPAARAFRVTRQGDEAVEQPLPVRHLG